MFGKGGTNGTPHCQEEAAASTLPLSNASLAVNGQQQGQLTTQPLRMLVESAGGHPRRLRGRLLLGGQEPSRQQQQMLRVTFLEINVVSCPLLNRKGIPHSQCANKNQLFRSTHKNAWADLGDGW